MLQTDVAKAGQVTFAEANLRIKARALVGDLFPFGLHHLQNALVLFQNLKLFKPNQIDGGLNFQPIAIHRLVSTLTEHGESSQRLESKASGAPG